MLSLRVTNTVISDHQISTFLLACIRNVQYFFLGFIRVKGKWASLTRLQDNFKYTFLPYIFFNIEPKASGICEGVR